MSASGTQLTASGDKPQFGLIVRNHNPSCLTLDGIELQKRLSWLLSRHPPENHEAPPYGAILRGQSMPGTGRCR